MLWFTDYIQSQLFFFSFCMYFTCLLKSIYLISCKYVVPLSSLLSNEPHERTDILSRHSLTCLCMWTVDIAVRSRTALRSNTEARAAHWSWRSLKDWRPGYFRLPNMKLLTSLGFATCTVFDNYLTWMYLFFDRFAVKERNTTAPRNRQKPIVIWTKTKFLLLISLLTLHLCSFPPVFCCSTQTSAHTSSVNLVLKMNAYKTQWCNSLCHEQRVAVAAIVDPSAAHLSADSTALMWDGGDSDSKYSSPPSSPSRCFVGKLAPVDMPL